MLHGDRYQRPIGVLLDVQEGRRIAGHLKLKKGDLFDSNVVSLVTADRVFLVAKGGSLHGISEAGKVTLLDCVQDSMLTITSWGDFTMHHGDIAFRYALFGERHLAADERSVRGITFTLGELQSNVFTNDKSQRYGHLLDPDEAVLNAIERTRPDEYLTGNFVKGKAMVSYFTGDWEYLPRFETVLGTVSVERSIQTDFFGLNMTDTPRITVEFNDDPSTLEGALGKMREIRQFFAWMMGYVPDWKDVVVYTSRLDEGVPSSEAGSSLAVFGPNEWNDVPDGAGRYGTLIDAAQYPDHFVKVMANWLERNENAERRRANERFFGSLQGAADRVIEDAIVSAANTFDLLPSDAKPPANPLPNDVLEVLAAASEKIKGCATLSEAQKQDVLSSLGFIRRNKRLRHIVEHRAEIVQEHFDQDALMQLDDVIGLAVKCRNYFVHGPNKRDSGAVDYADFHLVRFLTSTLEFIYGTSELLRCGWDPSKSVNTEWHPLGKLYLMNYNANLRRYYQRDGAENLQR